MKKKITFQNILLLFLAIIAAYRFSYIIAEKGEKSSQTTFTEDKDGFLNYVLLRPWIDDVNPPDPRSYWQITKHFDSFKELNFNASNMYAGDCNTLGVFSQDTLTTAQTNTLKNIFRQSEQNGLRCILGRSRIELACLSQRLVYEAEGGNYGFSYQRRSANVEQDRGRTVLHACKNESECPQTDATPRMLCDSIYENLQHTDLYYFQYGTDTTKWKVKPEMRIDTSDFAPGDATPVVAIIVTNYKGDIISTDTIRIRNFAQSNYTGDYINNYYDFDPTISGRRDSVNGLNYGRLGPGQDIKACRVDFKVYWFGLVDVWFDKMIVDDERADKLFDINPINNFDNKIHDEVNLLKDSIIYFVGEITSSQAQATKYVKNKIKDYCSTAQLQFAVSNNINLYSHRNPDTRARMLLDVVKPDLMCLDDHVFQMDSGYQIYLPNNLSTTQYDPRVPDSWKASPQTYNNSLQRNALGNKNEIVTPYQGTFIYQITRYRNDLKDLSVNTKFLVQPHLHSWTKTIINNFADYNAAFREPTNEEIQAEATIAIAHGVQSLNWECYHSENSNNLNYYEPETVQRDTFYTILGLRNNDSSKRTSNIIHQDKWEYVKAMNLKILHWKPTLDKVKWDSGYSVHYENAAHNFISDIKSIIVHSSPPTACEEDNINYDCQEERYWEMGFFVPDFGNPTVDQYDKSKYFMMVNRRCVPDTQSNGHGDLRQLKIKFDSTQLPGFRNWKIIEMDSNKVIRTFDKDSNIYIDMKIFQPGEGKLYKLAPVMQEGGALVTNERVEGITFVCNGPVNNNGKDISILEGTKINFKSGAGINMTGGKLTCSNYSTNTSENVLLKGYNGPWNGIVMNNCMRSVIQRTRFEDAKNCIVISNGTGGSKYTAKVIRRNYFKVSADSGKALTINNQMEMAIDSNTFEITSFENTAGIYYVNNDNTEPEAMPQAEEGIPEDEIGAGYINITKNTFNGAYFPVMINDVGSNFSQFYIYNNEFINTGLFGITGRKITGTIKQNKFTDEAQSYCLSLYDCSPDISGNIFRSDKKNIALASSFPLLGPIRNENNQLVFKGGRNILTITSTTVAADNIFMKNSLPEIYLGENNFTIGNTYSNHIYGSTPSQIQRIFRAGRNCWDGNNSIPMIFLYEGTNFNPIGYDYLPTSCIPSEEITPEIAGVGFGISDTTIVINYDSTDILMSDQSLAYEAKDLLGSGDYSGAIANYKALIDTYDSSEFIYGAVDYLYSCYQSLDTSSDEATTDILYSDLKEYLESKISSGNYDEAFEEHAFDFVLMCETRLTNYNEALAGYEFIVTYNPDMEARLLASWEYQNIQDLLEGESGGRSNYELQITNYKFKEDEKELYNNLEIEKRIKQLDELIDRDPVKKHLKEKFVKSADENIKAVKEGKAVKKNPNDEKFIERSKQNIYGSRNLTKKQKEIRRFEDLKLLLNPDNLVVNKNIENAVPPEYSLSQNYPNPFNPVTHLEFGVPNPGFVSLKIYDMLGRELKTLVNEIKPAGRFNVEFDGSNFASGVYFYRLEAGDFVQTKRMVLVK